MASNKLQKKDYTRASLRAYFLQNGMNYSNYQGLGYANMLYPGLRKIYDDDDQLRDALKENVEFFNTNPSMVPFIGNLHLAMLDGGANAKEVKSIKMALMGPMAGIGDSLSQFCLAPRNRRFIVSVLSGTAVCDNRCVACTGWTDPGTGDFLPWNEYHASDHQIIDG